MSRATRSVVIASEDVDTIRQIQELLINRDYTPVIEKSALKCIVKVLDQEQHFLILDLDRSKGNFLDLIGIIKKTRPRLPIVTLSKDNSLQTLRALTEAGVFYCLLKPMHSEEIENVLEAVTRYHDRHWKKPELVR